MKYLVIQQTEVKAGRQGVFKPSYRFKSSAHPTFALAKLHFNKLLQIANVGDYLTIVYNSQHTGKHVIYRIWNEGKYKGRVVVDNTENTMG